MDDIILSVYKRKQLNFTNGVYSAGEEIRTLLGMFIDEVGNSGPGKQIFLSSLSTSIAVKLLRDIKNSMPYFEKLIDGYEGRRIRDVVDFMNDCCKNDCSIEEMAAIAGLSSYHFIRTFKQHTGKTPYEYFLDIKVVRAKKLLEDRELSITEVGLECGFNNITNFNRMFKKKTGFAPSVYRSMVVR